MNAVVVDGISMRPFLISGDVLLVKEIDRPLKFGNLVLARNLHDEPVVHRYLGPGKIKGDRVKYWDDIKSIDYVILARMDQNQKYDLTTNSINKLLGALSFFNQKKFIVIHHLSAFMISILGKWGRNGK